VQEYVGEAIILNKESLGDLDGRYSFFTERMGKVIGKTKSSRKITSKLAPHLEPGNLARVRYIDRNGTQIVDALKIERLRHGVNELHILSRLLPEALPEPSLWEMLRTGSFSWPLALEILGWDPREAQCIRCDAAKPPYFHLRRQEFFCNACASKLRNDEVILVVNN